MKNEDLVWAAKADLDARCPPAGSRWMHVKTASVCEIITGCLRYSDMAPMLVYRSDDTGICWVTIVGSFLDGRFERLPDTPAPAENPLV